jgi:hypothetical protein
LPRVRLLNSEVRGSYSPAVRLALGCVLALALAPAAGAATPGVSATTSSVTGLTPLEVTLRAHGDAASYHWKLGDGSAADGRVVRHVYRRPGLYTAVVIALASTGESGAAGVSVAAFRLTLAGPRSTRHRQRVRSAAGSYLPSWASA